MHFCLFCDMVWAMSDPLSSLPNDLEALKAFALAMAEKAAHADRLEAEVAALRAQNMDVEARLARLTSLLKSLERARYGKRSEKLGPDAAEQQNFVFEEIETGSPRSRPVSTRLQAWPTGPSERRAPARGLPLTSNGSRW